MTGASVLFWVLALLTYQLRAAHTRGRHTRDRRRARPTAVGVQEAPATLDPAAALAMATHPLTGLVTLADRVDPTAGKTEPATAPAARRKPTPRRRRAPGGSLAAALAALEDSGPQADPGPSATPERIVAMTLDETGPSLDDATGATLLADAWKARDFDAMAALADSPTTGGALAGAAHALAAVLAGGNADPRGHHHLLGALASHSDPATDPICGPLLAGAVVALRWPGLDICVDAPATTWSFVAQAAIDDLLLDDVESAYQVLLGGPEHPLVRTLTAQCALAMGRPLKALLVAQGEPGPTGPYSPALLTIEGDAHLAGADGARARCAYDGALTLAGEDDHSQVGARALLGRARAMALVGDNDGAWADLTLLAGRHPGYPGAADLAKKL